MLSPESITSYQRTCNAAAGYCAACTKPLAPDETYPHGVIRDEETQKAVQES
ncbi:hypothetical protein E2L00_07035 [Cedecea colo]|uniref:Uncharacterized protein n=1 Tax=Cedecea colo TaxID=2552946 RepID=A0ABX0VJW3_9ENTR|nr:hypothetical protein [Cedecea colo]